MKKDIEKQLVERLKLVGFILIGFAVAASLYALIPIDKAEETEQLFLEELEELEPLNPLLVSTIFSGAGSSCLWISKKKREKLL